MTVSAQKNGDKHVDVKKRLLYFEGGYPREGLPSRAYKYLVISEFLFFPLT